MAMSTQENSNLIKLIVGMFNASPGAAYLADLTTIYEGNGRSLVQVARGLSGNPLFIALSPASQTAGEFAAWFLAPLGLQGDGVALDFVTGRFNAGMNKGQIIYESLVALLETTAPEYRDAQAILNNKAAVAYHHSVNMALSSTDVTALQAVLLPVTEDPATIIYAESLFDPTLTPLATIATVALSADTGVSGTDFITKTAAQTISGTTSANLVSGETVEVSIDNGTTWTTATTSVGANTFSLSDVTLSASDTLKVRVSDSAGDKGIVASQAYVLDTTAPTTTISTIAFSADTATKTAALSGTTSANLVSGEHVEVSINNGSTWTTAITSVGANIWSLSGVTLTGSDTLKVRVSDAAGNTGTVASQDYLFDTTPPTTTIATMAFSADTGVSSIDLITKTAAQTIFGTTSVDIVSGERVEVSLDNGSTWTTAITSVGANTWSLSGVTLTASDTLKVRVSDAAGNTGTVASRTYVLDATAPTTAIATVAFSADTGISGTDFNTKTAAQTIFGNTNANLLAGEHVEISINNGSTWTAATTSVGATTFSLSGVTLSASDTFKVRVSDVAGNTGTVTSQAYVFDTTAPTTTIATMAFSADTGVSSTDFITSTAAQTISGTTSANLVAGESVEVSNDNGSTWATATTSVGTNTWSLAGVTLTASGTLKVRVTDTAGNSGTVASQVYVFDTTVPTEPGGDDTTAPSAPGTPDLTSASDSGSSSTDNITSVTTGTFTGTAEAGSTVRLYDTDGTTLLGSATANGSGIWSITSSALSQGSHTLTAKATDVASNTSAASAGLTVTIDTAAPTATIATTAFSADTGSSSTDFITKTTAQTISGTTSANMVAGESVEVSIDNGSTWMTATSTVGANTWSLAGVTLTASDTLKVRVTDTAGNSGTVASQAYVLDSTAPTTTIATMAFSADTGVSSTDFITSTAAQTISGTTSANLVAGESVEVSIDNGSTWATATTSVGANTWSLAGVTLTASDTLKVRVTDTAGNSGTVASQAYVFDSTGPATTIATMAFSADTGVSGTDFITSTAVQTISGTTSANLVVGETVEVSIDNGSTWTTATSSVGANTWSLSGVTLTASDTLKVRVSDADGNSGTVASQAYVLDTTAPTTTIATIAFSADTGVSGTDFITSTAAQTISGTTSANLVAGELVEVSLDNGSTWTTATTSVGANTFSLSGVTLTASDTLKVRVSDAAGNTGTVASQAYVFDTTAPTTTIATMAFSADTGVSSTDFITSTAAQTISGTTSANLVAGESVEVSIDNGSTWATATTSVGANTWSLAGVTLTASDTLKVRVTDTAGNSGTVASQAYVFDNTTSTTTIATIAFSADTGVSGTDFITKTAAQTISGTTSANLVSGERVEVSIDNGSTWTTSTTSVGANTWSLAGVTLTGSDTLKVRVSDSAGNAGTVASQAYVFDTTAPTTTIATMAFSADTGVSGTDFITSTAAQTISGTTSANLVAGELVEVSIDNGSTWTTATTSVGANTWSLAGVTLTASDTLKVRVTDTAGNSGTVASQAYVLDSAAPTLASSSPADGSATLAVGSNLTLTFNETVVLGTGNIVLKASTGDSVVESFNVATGVGSAGGTVMVSGTTITINPFANLSAGTDYNVRVDATAVLDTASNTYPGIADATTLNFTTAATPVTTAVPTLTSLDGSNGFRLTGAAAGNYAGQSIGSAGDVNGDGYADVMIGATGAGGASQGAEYVVFGKASGFSASRSLGTVDGTDGFAMNGGFSAQDFVGVSGISAGDVNGDGYGDMIVGASGADPNGGGSGTAVVVFGKASGFSASWGLGSVNGTDGFRLNGAAGGDGAGFSVSGAGDMNGDGYADLIIGANQASSYRGASYVVFGKASGFSAAMNLSALTGSDGFVLPAVNNYDYVGTSVSGAGDVNGDGYDDVIVGAMGVDANGSNSGAAYVVFGKASAFSASLNPSSLDGSNGFRLAGLAAGDQAGVSVGAAGDVNGDGYADMIVGANGLTNNGGAFVVFGKASGFSASMNLSTLDGTNGFRMDGVASGDNLGIRVSGAGDVNGDGYADVLVGATGVDTAGSNAGAAYVVFGKASGFGATVALTSLDGSNGFKLNSLAAGDNLSRVGAAGDVNGDGYADLMVGTSFVDVAGNNAGAAFVVFGGNFSTAVTFLGTSGVDALNAGTSAAEHFIAGDDSDSMTGGGGADVFHGGRGNDVIAVSDLTFRLVDGGTGTDTLALGGSGLALDLASVRGRLTDIEVIDLSGSGNNSLALNALDIGGLSDISNTLKVDGNAGDSVSGLSGWIDGGISAGYHTYTQDALVVLVGVDVTIV